MTKYIQRVGELCAELNWQSMYLVNLVRHKYVINVYIRQRVREKLIRKQQPTTRSSSIYKQTITSMIELKLWIEKASVGFQSLKCMCQKQRNGINIKPEEELYQN